VRAHFRKTNRRLAYRLCDVVHDHGAVGVTIVHGRQGLVTLLAGRIPDLELDSRVLIERDGLSEERRTDRRFSEGIELILVLMSFCGCYDNDRFRITYLDESQNY
jgi:hypothetical protein